MPDKFASQEERELIRRAMEASRRFASGAAEGAGQAIGDQYLSLAGGDGIPYGRIAAENAEARVASDRDAFIAENSAKPWYEQAYNMAAGMAEAPAAIARGIGSEDPEGFGEQVGAGAVPNAYGYATKPKEMLQASPIEAGMAMASIIPPGKILNPARKAIDPYFNRMVVGDVSRHPRDRFKDYDREVRVSGEKGDTPGYGSPDNSGNDVWGMPEFVDAAHPDDYGSGYGSRPYTLGQRNNPGHLSSNLIHPETGERLGLSGMAYDRGRDMVEQKFHPRRFEARTERSKTPSELALELVNKEPVFVRKKKKDMPDPALARKNYGTR